MLDLKNQQVPRSSLSLTSLIMKDQGSAALWRGNMPKIYFNGAQTFLRVTFFDRVKNYWMPYDVSKYSGFDYFWRVGLSATIC